MDTETLALLSQSAEEADPAPSSPPSDPSDQPQRETETPVSPVAAQGIPEGYTRDARTGEIRPKKTRGRPRNGTTPPKPETPINRSQDETPDSKAKGKLPPATPKWSKGVIAAGMTKMYRRTGRILKAMDRDLGIAVIESAEDCGEAWDELARTNPRIRGTLMRMISGGAWGSVIMAHMPILMAILMKERIRQHIPFGGLLGSLMSDDEDGPAEDDGNPFADLLGNMTEEDMQQAMNLAGSFLPGMMARRVPGTVIRGEAE